MSSKKKSPTVVDEGATLVPKLRFPEFQYAAAWDTAPGDELFQQVSNREAPPGLPILAITQEHGAIPRHKIDYSVSVTDKSLETYKEVRPGDFIISLRSFQGGIEFSEYHGICSPAYVILRKRGQLSDRFYRQHFKSHAFIQQLTRNLEGLRDGKMISYKQFSELQLLKPTLPEQQKIADCLDSADALIAAQGQKVEALRAHKKGLMQQLFPRPERVENGIKIPAETQPRLRFPEFEGAGEWEEHKLGDVCELYQPVTLSSSELTMTGEHLVYGANGVIGTHNEYNHADSEVAVTCRGATCGEVTRTQPMSWITGNAMVVRPRSARLEKDFLFQYFKNHGLKSIISGSAQPQITRAGFSPLPVSFPAPAEQQRIANCLTSLDDLITAETRKLDTFKTHKKGLMQQLFPKVGESDA